MNSQRTDWVDAGVNSFDWRFCPAAVYAVPMKTKSMARSPVLALVAGVLLACAGCQTCSLSKEDFEKQQAGQTVDRETGEAVSVMGTLGYFGAMMGEAIAAAFGK